MIGSFLTRGLVMVFGYAYPAYECYKTVEKNRPEIEQLRFWCQYWILVAVLTVSERLGDTFISWVPMYSEAKLAFFIYLWYPKTRGTTYVYDSFFKPYVAKHENEIDRNLLELRTRAGDMAVLYWQRAASYGQTRVFEILQYVAAQSTPRPSTTQVKAHPPASALNRQPSARQPAPAQPENKEPPSPTSSTSSSQQFMDEAEEVVPQAREPTAPPAGIFNPLKGPAAISNAQKAPAGASSNPKANATPETSLQSLSSKDEAMITEAAPSSTNANANSPKKESSNMDGGIRVTRATLRKSRSGLKS
ncbi:putative HVA22-like protein g [Euphorbia lathyris]|uniref:putative HVA22-like protein g n=1 Tax=Euphorbia lathyris TaxID=212925 RepID=UPI0033142A24